MCAQEGGSSTQEHLHREPPGISDVSTNSMIVIMTNHQCATDYETMRWSCGAPAVAVLTDGQKRFERPSEPFALGGQVTLDCRQLGHSLLVPVMEIIKVDPSHVAVLGRHLPDRIDPAARIGPARAQAALGQGRGNCKTMLCREGTVTAVCSPRLPQLFEACEITTASSVDIGR